MRGILIALLLLFSGCSNTTPAPAASGAAATPTPEVAATPEVLETPSAEEAEKYLKSGKNLLQGGKPEAAIEDLEMGLRALPNDLQGLRDLASAYAKTGRYQKGLDVCDRTLELSPDRAELFLERGQIRLLNDDRESAHKDFDKAIELEPRLEYYLNRGMSYFNWEKYELAEKDFRSALKLDPKNAPANTQLARTLRKLGRNEEADQLFLQGRRINKRIEPNFRVPPPAPETDHE